MKLTNFLEKNQRLQLQIQAVMLRLHHNNKNLTNYGQNKVQNHPLLLFISGQADILVCPIYQKLTNIA
jgi:hypothetical protein